MKIFLTVFAIFVGIVLATGVASAQTPGLYCFDEPAGAHGGTTGAQVTAAVWYAEIFTVPSTEVWEVSDLSVAIVRGSSGTDANVDVSLWTTLAGAPDTQIGSWVNKTVTTGTHVTSGSLGGSWTCDPDAYFSNEARYGFELASPEVLTGGDYAIVTRLGAGSGTLSVFWQRYISIVPSPAEPLLRSTDSGGTWAISGAGDQKAENAVVGILAAVVPGPPATLETKIQSWDAAFGTGVFLIVLVIAIFGMHAVWNVPHEMIYAIGLVIGTILSHDSVAVLEPFWLIAGAALIAAIYIYRLVFQSGSD